MIQGAYVVDVVGTFLEVCQTDIQNKHDIILSRIAIVIQPHHYSALLTIYIIILIEKSAQTAVTHNKEKITIFIAKVVENKLNFPIS